MRVGPMITGFTLLTSLVYTGFLKSSLPPYSLCLTLYFLIIHALFSMHVECVFL